MYDIIGDIHGFADELMALLSKLGYSKTNGIWSHPTRTLISIGDLVDRGTLQREVIDILKPMQQAGHAQVIMGNHEFNAVAYYKKDQDGNYLRSHTQHNYDQHEAFLKAAKTDPRWYAETIDWFCSLPLLIETDEIACVHACWDDKKIAELKSFLDDDFKLKEDAWINATSKYHPLYDIIEFCLKGPEVQLPNGASFKDFGGKTRDKIRLRWWDLQSDSTYASVAISVPHDAEIPNVLISDSFKIEMSTNKLIFFGHYWMRGTPTILAPKVACLDWTVVDKGGHLVAYRFDGETTLSNDKLVWVSSKASTM